LVWLCYGENWDRLPVRKELYKQMSVILTIQDRLSKLFTVSIVFMLKKQAAIQNFIFTLNNSNEEYN